jgi:hypothetical protein
MLTGLVQGVPFQIFGPLRPVGVGSDRIGGSGCRIVLAPAGARARPSLRPSALNKEARA